MAYVNVKDWSVDQVTDWLKGLDNVILPYAKSFLNNGVNGYQLLNLRADDLEHLGVLTLGHQEIILEAVEHLRNLHYELDKENLQMLALRLSCAANSLYKELLLADDDSKMVETQTMSDVHNIITTIKPLVCWLDRSPFQGDKDYIDNKTQLLQLGFEMATCAHRDIFSEKPNRTIRNICEKLAKMADHIIQDISDPMILQPASLDLATLKKKEQELGFFIMPNNHAVHQIAEIKYGSPAHGSTKIEEGDEIVQVNYQTVVGWQRKKVLMLLQESPPEIVLTLKKRPRHTKVYGQIYMKPYRLPSKKKSTQPYSRWNENLPSPRLLNIHDLLHLPTLKLPPVSEPEELAETSSSSSESEAADGSVRMYPMKPRPVLQRRYTITGTTPTSKRPYPDLDEYWQMFRNRNASAHSSSYNIDHNTFEDSSLLRDKSVSCSHGLELAPRPTTVIGLAQRNDNKIPSFKKEFNEKSSIRKRVNFEDTTINALKKIEPDMTVNTIDQNKETIDSQYLGFPTVSSDDKSLSVNSLSSLTENIAFIDEGREITDRSSMTSDWHKDNESGCTKSDVDNQKNVLKDAALADVHIRNIIKKFDGQNKEKPKVLPRSNVKKEVPQRPDKKPAVPVRSATTKLRGKLDKSHSTPAYDLSQDEIVEPKNMEGVQLDTKIEKETIISTYTESKKFEIEITPIINTEQITKESETSTSTVSNEPSSNEASPNKSSTSSPITPNSSPPKEILPPKPQTFKTEATIPTDEDKPRLSPELELPPRSPKAPVVVPQKPVPVPPPKSPAVQIVPPTRPPRTFPILELPKPPPIQMPDTTSRYAKSNFEFPELKSEAATKGKAGFEPRSISTPTRKFDRSDYADGSSTHEKSVNEKVSPTNSIVRGLIYANKNKSVAKKKNLLIGKRRKVTVSDFNSDDMQGYLYQRLRNKHSQPVVWEKRWFVLSGSCLYGFKSKESPKAACLIFLSGFTVAVANEVKSRTNAFKVYHTGTVYYFSAENQETTATWIESITAATLHGDAKGIEQGLCSETDESDSEKPKTSSDKPPETVRKFGSLKKFAHSKKDSSSSGSTSLDRKWFFNKSTANPKNAVPVPTAQFRSYRKIKTGNDAGSVSTGNFTSHVPIYASRLEIPTLAQSQNVSVPNLTVEGYPLKGDRESEKATKAKSRKNYVHFSNPSLCNSSDYGMQTKTMQQENENLAGFVTLEELMNRQAEERKLNPHNKLEDVNINLNSIKPDVVYGEVPIRSKEKQEEPNMKRTHSRAASDSSKQIEKQEPTSSCFGKRLGSMKKSNKSEAYDGGTYPKSAKGIMSKYNRSLPRMHKLQENPEFSGKSRQESQREKSYEMIYCPQTVTDVQFAQNRPLDDKMCKDTTRNSGRIIRQHSLSTADKRALKFQKDDSQTTTFLPYRGAKIADSSTAKVKLKSAVQYTPMSLPLAQDPKGKLNPRFAFELNLDEKASTKSGKFKFFSKHNDSKKEKSFLGSPKLHRALFRKASSDSEQQISSTDLNQLTSASDTSLENSSANREAINVINLIQHPDYPGLEYPPIFEPETYSLADPQSSLTLIRKQNEK